MNVLQAKLLERRRQEEQAKMDALKGDGGNSWGNQMRSYVLHPYQMVKDLRTEHEVGNPQARARRRDRRLPRGRHPLAQAAGAGRGRLLPLRPIANCRPWSAVPCADFASQSQSLNRRQNHSIAGHRACNGLDDAVKNGKGDARHAYDWGACERGRARASSGSGSASLRHHGDAPLRCSIDEYSYWG